MANTNLVLLQGNETFTCKSIKSEITLSAIDQNTYCLENDTIAITAVSVNAHYDTPGGMEKFGVAASLAHEFGHTVQDLEDRLNPLYYDSQAKTNLEIDATRLSGKFLATKYSPTILNVMAAKLSRESIDTYGGARQGDALLEGAGLK